MAVFDDLPGKTALVTGAYSGLGLHFARTLGRHGVRVALCGRRAALGRQIASDIQAAGGQAVAIGMDVTDPASVESAFDAAEQALGPLHIVVNNAGVTITRPAMEMTEADWSGVIDVNLNGCWRVAQAAGRRMRRGEVRGSIINIASILGRRVAAQVSAYSASKAGLIHLTRSLALEWARYGIRVNCLAPGYVETDLNRDFFATQAGQDLIRRIPQRRLGRPADLDAPLLLLASEGSAFMTGSVLDVDGGHLVGTL